MRLGVEDVTSQLFKILTVVDALRGVYELRPLPKFRSLIFDASWGDTGRDGAGIELRRLGCLVGFLFTNHCRYLVRSFVRPQSILSYRNSSRTWKIQVISVLVLSPKWGGKDGFHDSPMDGTVDVHHSYPLIDVVHPRELFDVLNFVFHSLPSSCRYNRWPRPRRRKFRWRLHTHST